MVIPTLNEAACIGGLLATLLPLVDEVIVADGGSADDTVGIARCAGARVATSARGRGLQLDAGAAVASHERCWFLHADSSVTGESVDALRRATGGWGCFETTVASDDPRLAFAGAWMNARARWTGRCTGDMGIWCDRALFDSVGGFGALSAFEDVSFVDRARAVSSCAVLRPGIVTSARRWAGEGVTATIVKGWTLRLGYRVGVNPMRLARSYSSQPR